MGARSAEMHEKSPVSGGFLVGALVPLLAIACSGGAGGRGGISGGAHGMGRDIGGTDQCDGVAGLSCDENEYCDYAGDVACGIGGQTGACKLRPDVCPPDCPGVCGCDGMFYCNSCDAAALGMDVNPTITCSP